jgi:hypothetical protein
MCEEGKRLVEFKEHNKNKGYITGFQVSFNEKYILSI